MKPPRFRMVSPAALLISSVLVGGAGIAVAESTYQPWSGSSQAQSVEQTPAQRLQKLLTDGANGAT